MRRTKIVCTLGPSSNSEYVLREMLLAGMNIARLNFSHGSHDDHAKNIETFRRIRDSLGVPAAIMLDTKGPEIRLGEIIGGSATLKEGETFILTARDIEGSEKEVSVTYKPLATELKEGDMVLIDDGRISLRVTGLTDTDVITKVEIGGKISTHKGVNIPNVSLDMPYISKQDASDLLFGIEQGVDFVSASFGRKNEDVIELRRFLDYHGGHDIKIISKIENIQGVMSVDEVLGSSDGIMIA